MKTVSIKHTYWDIAADIYFPDDFNSEKKYPAIISAHPIGSCKEQPSGSVYGAALAMRVKDFSIVVDYLTSLPYVDAGRIGVLGICGGGGYAINAAMTERRIKAIGTVTGANYGRLMREGFTAFNPIGALEAMAQQRTDEANGAKLRVDDLLPSSPEAALEAGLTEIDLFEATEYYRSPRGCAPNGVNRSLFSHQTVAVGWDAFHLAEVLLTQPIMVVVGDRVGAFGAYRDGCEIIGRAASKHKELVVVEGYSHYDLYDKPEPVKQALDKLIPFYKTHL